MGCCSDCCVSPKESREPIRYEPDFSGPVHNRSCTDILWLIVFILFLGAWGYVGYYGMTNGNVEKLLAPIDSRGHRCGMDSGLEDRKYLMFFDLTRCLSPGTPITGCPTQQICVNKCPDETIVFPTRITDAASFEQVRKKMVCSDDVIVPTMTYTQALDNIRSGKCASFVLRSQPVVGRCFPFISEAMAVIREVNDNLANLDENQVLEQLGKLIQFDQLPGSKGNFLNYEEEAMERVIDNVRRHNTCLCKAAAKFGVLRQTLANKSSGKPPVERKMGPATMLTKEEEQRICQWVYDSAAAGFPITQSQLLFIIERYLNDLKRDCKFFKNNKPGKTFLELFMNRNKGIASRTSQNHIIKGSCHRRS